MVENRVYVVLVAIALAAAIIGGIHAFYVPPVDEQPVDEQPVDEQPVKDQAKDTTITEEESLNIARGFVLTSPTYKYDGAHLEHIDTMILQSPSCWQFTFEFTSRHAGYGNRSKQMVLQVITKHTAVVTVHNGEVTYAVLDGQWDMISQKKIDDTTNE